MSDNSFWAEKFNETVQQHVPDTLPTPTIPQASVVDEPDVSDPEWRAANARIPQGPGTRGFGAQVGSDIIQVPTNRSWQTNSGSGQEGVGILGKPQGRKARAEVAENIRSGRYDTATGNGVLGGSNPRAAAATIAALTREGAFDTDRGDMDIISR